MGGGGGKDVDDYEEGVAHVDGRYTELCTYKADIASIGRICKR